MIKQSGRIAGKLFCIMLSGLIVLPSSAIAFDRLDAYIARLDRRVPELLVRYNVPSAALAVVHDGQTFVRSFGAANLETGRSPSDTTLYNVASISKVIAAWGILRLVEKGRVSLDAPVSTYLPNWKLPPSEWNNEVTIRRLLSHTSGLSMPAVPQYGPGDRVPSLPEMLANGNDPVRVTSKPGASFQYSGGGYAILQMVIEEITKESFGAYIESEILKPLGMNHSTFRVPPDGDPSAATPYDSMLRSLPHYRFAAEAAAGMYTTARDLAAFARASMLLEDSGRSPLSRETIELMETRVPVEKDSLFGHGLGYSIGPLPVAGQSAGHSGSNDGWTAIFEVIPGTKDALVILLNRSDAFPVYRDLLCEWVEAVQGKKWPGFCNDSTPAWTAADSTFVDRLFEGIHSTDPASAVLVATAEGIVYRKAFGSADLQSGRQAQPETTFYVASIAKSMTGLAALKLAEEGRWSLSDPIGTYLPELPSYILPATLDQLLSHTSGVPDYYSLIDWSQYTGIDNSRAIDLLRGRSALEFPAGSRYKYSNSGYVLVATAIERLTGKNFSDALRETVLTPAGMEHTVVYDSVASGPQDRAIGYSLQSGTYVVSDYQTVTVSGRQFPFRSTTVGAGGIYSTLDDLYALDQALAQGKLVSPSLSLMATSPRTLIDESPEIPDTVGHGLGWFTSARHNKTLIWNTGDMAGHRSALLRFPGEKITIIVLNSGGAPQPEDIALQIADRILGRKDSEK